MNNMFLKAGLILFILTLIVNWHLNNSKYYSINKKVITNIYYYHDVQSSLKHLDMEEVRASYLFYTKRQYTSEEYYNVLDAVGADVRGLFLKHTESEIKLFKFSKSLVITIILIIATLLIGFGLNLKNCNRLDNNKH